MASWTPSRARRALAGDSFVITVPYTATTAKATVTAASSVATRAPAARIGLNPPRTKSARIGKAPTARAIAVT